MKLVDLIELAKRGEDEKLEFKSAPAKSLPEDVCAFLNTEGGTVLVGVSDQGEILGVESVQKARQKISDLMGSVTPAPKIKISSVSLSPLEKKGKWVVAVETEKGHGLYSHRNRAYIRVGRNNRSLTINELVEKASESVLGIFRRAAFKPTAKRNIQKMFENYLDRRSDQRRTRKQAPRKKT